MRIEQTFHGYSQGHRLLTSSGGLDAEELDLLDRLSDLSGYLPAGLHYERYFTGFPCRRFYAFACTWPDLNAARSGTVLTHTLLAPLHEVTTLPDLFALERLHRVSREDKESYATCLHWEAPPAPELSPPATTRDPVATLLFGQSQHPIVWIDDADRVAPVRWAWHLLWPKARAHWAFCTLALQPRSISSRPFSWLAAPTQARSGLHRLASSTAWWDRGQLLDRTVRERSAEPWVADFRAPSEPRTLVQRTLDAGLAEVQPHQLLLAKRFLELETSASQRLPAARTRADLLQQLAPSLQTARTTWHRVLVTLVEHQAAAPLDPRPLWDLEDLLRRPALREVLTEPPPESSTLVDNIRTMLEHELERRILARPDTAIPRLAPLAHEAEVCGLSTTVQIALSMALGKLLARTTDSSATTAQLRSVALSNDAPAPLVAAIVRHLPASDQRETLTNLVDTGRDDDFLQRLTEDLDDAELAFEFHRTRGGDPSTGLELAARIHGKDGPDSAWQRVLAATTPEVAWRWSLKTRTVTPELLRTTWRWCGQRGNATQLAQIAEGTPLGGNAMLVASAAFSLGLGEIFRQHPSLAIATIMAGLSESGWEADRVIRLAIENASSSALADVNFCAALEASPNIRRVDEIIEKLLPELMRQWLTHTDDDPALAERWFATLSLQRFIARAPSYKLEQPLRQHHIGKSAIAVGLPRLFDTLKPASFGEVEWAIPLLSMLVQRADSASLLEVADMLVMLFDLPLASGKEAQDSHIRIMGEVLGAVRRTQCARCTQLVTATFYPVYTRLWNDHPGPLRDCTWWSEMWWDRAKTWRHWLLDTAVGADWPGHIIRDAAHNDRTLLDRLGKRANKKGPSRAYWARTQT